MDKRPCLCLSKSSEVGRGTFLFSVMGTTAHLRQSKPCQLLYMIHALQPSPLPTSFQLFGTLLPTYTISHGNSHSLHFSYCPPSLLVTLSGQFSHTSMSASASPVQECRRHLHVVTFVHNCIELGYFVVVLVVGGEQLWKSAIILYGLAQFPLAIGGILTIRMWIYT